MNLLYPFKRIYSSREDVNTLLRFWGMQYLGALLTDVIQSGFTDTEYFSFAIDTSTKSTPESSPYLSLRFQVLTKYRSLWTPPRGN